MECMLLNLYLETLNKIRTFIKNKINNMENQTNKKFEPSKKLVKSDGTIAYIFDNKLHNWEGPALIPEGNNRKREYYINGIKLTETSWKLSRKEREGLPWYKGSSAKGSTNRF
jgi:hypothetical protein